MENSRKPLISPLVSPLGSLHSILVSSRVDRLVTLKFALDFAFGSPFSRILLGFTEYYWVLLGFTGFYCVLLSFNEYPGGPIRLYVPSTELGPSVPNVNRVLPSFTEFYRVFVDVLFDSGCRRPSAGAATRATPCGRRRLEADNRSTASFKTVDEFSISINSTSPTTTMTLCHVDDSLG